MPLKTPEEKQKAIKWLLSQAKMFGITFVLATGSVWGVAEYYLEDYVENTVERVFEEKSDSKTFREILGSELGLSPEKVPYYLVDKFGEVDTLIFRVFTFQSKYSPILERDLSKTKIERYLDGNGDEWWSGYDGRDYRVNYENGKAWVVYHGFRRDI